MKKEKHAYKCRFRSLFPPPPLLSMIIASAVALSCIDIAVWRLIDTTLGRRALVLVNK